MNEKLFAERLAQIRTQKGYTAREMSLSLEQSDSYINKIENQKIKPSISMFFSICEYLEISEKDFFDIENKYPARLKDIIENLKQLDDDALANLSGVVEKMVGNSKQENN